MIEEPLCEVPGQPDELVTKAELNRFMRILGVMHLRPVKKAVDHNSICLSEIKGTLNTHMTEEERILRRLLVIGLVTMASMVLGLIVYIWRTHHIWME